MHIQGDMQVRFQAVSCSVTCYTPAENILVIILIIM